MMLYLLLGIGFAAATFATLGVLADCSVRWWSAFTQLRQSTVRPVQQTATPLLQGTVISLAPRRPRLKPAISGLRQYAA